MEIFARYSFELTTYSHGITLNCPSQRGFAQFFASPLNNRLIDFLIFFHFNAYAGEQGGKINKRTR